jgi:DNA-binding CsgD family transcriptional regulator
MVVEGPLAPWAASIAGRLESLGYRPTTMVHQLRLVGKLSRFPQQRDLTASGLSGDAMEEFVGELQAGSAATDQLDVELSAPARWPWVQSPASRRDTAREVLDHIAQGHSTDAMARKLILNPKTVRNHVSNIFTGSKSPDRAQAIVRARDAGVGQPGRPDQRHEV